MAEPADQQIHDLLIIGTGSVGLTMAATWARLGRSAVIADKQEKLYGLPRVGHIDHEIMRVLQRLEAEGPTLEDAFPTEQYTWINAEGEKLLEFPWGEEGISGWHSAYLLNSAILERSLLECVEASPMITRLPGWQAVGLTQHADHVEVVFERTRTAEGSSVPELIGEQRVLRGRYVVAADGANSLVRRLLGVDREDLGFNERWLVVDARLKRPLRLAFDCGQICDPRRPTTVLPLGLSHRRWEWHLRPEEDAADFTPEAKAWELLGALGVASEDVELVRQLVYTFEARLAHQWRVGRVFLAGDAAHTMPPFMGQGMCSGMRDALNLAWKLDLVLAGTAPDSLLDTYQLERHPHVRDWTLISIESGKVPCIIDPEAARERDEMFRAGYRPPMPDFPQLVEGIVHRVNDTLAAPAGELGLQARVAAADGRVDLLDRFMPADGFTLLSLAADPATVLDDIQLRDLQRLGTTFIQLAPQGTPPAPGRLVDVEGTYARYLKQYTADAVLVRPDFYVFGASQLAELPILVDDLLRQVLIGSLNPA
ncbi:bifunctional 3-(3-hydroxy-phenyl)propionate/3-hydroxycinnamic acid hydroxylase [Streptomyces fulvoviolaceus]|uniref:bifunctional 3-(3-hydroxy-phenyl)propionate/3-hydroxycinnamic acid hydroxylase MhpA n=1 Tax=Streptomyces fulvoviolaceus TaxID=285535 RepID=UPI0004C5291B|nr:bifunctional 3-(3-hydroxy-phenyl)propionate/3-hydroxycinnamic acid hydroxylase [Streptomyces fulvoviolaceus]